MIKGRIGQLENAREANPSDMAALEEEAVSYAQLLEYEKAADLLDKLVAARPKDAEAWRLLGETTLLSQQSQRAVAAYEKAAALSSDDIQVLTGLADAYIANAQPAKAIEFLSGLKYSRKAAATPDSVTSGLSARTSSDDTASAASPSTVDSAALDLLTAKVYGSWRGHDNDALAVYDGLIKASPEDFRGYLAKGLFLKEHGRKADAERMFIQARFYAPASRQAFIKRMAEVNPTLDLPGDD